jgi:glycogen(starch) synthase
VVGDGSERARLSQSAAALGLAQSVTFAGRVSDEELHAWYEAADLLVHPSRYEGSSIVTLEAMAHGRPVIATRAGGLPDKVFPGVNGWLVPADDPGALADAIAKALSRDAALGAMGDASRRIIVESFAWSAAIDRLLRVYDEVLVSRVL